MMDDWKRRVVVEREQLVLKLDKLRAYVQTMAFMALSEAERSRLRNQERFMAGYAAMLDERIAAFRGTEE